MKQLMLSAMLLFFLTTSMTSCRNTNNSDPKKDVVEDLNDVMKPVEEEVEELLNQDSISNKSGSKKEDSLKILK